jgi:transposase
VNKKEMEAMRKRIRELEMENEILKKVTAIFARKP